MNRPIPRLERQTLRIAYGIAAGLLADSLLMVMSTLWVAMLLWPVLLPLAVGGSIGAIAPLRGRSSARTRTTRRFGTDLAVMILVVWPLCFFGPIAGRWLQFYWEATTLVSLCPQCRRADVHITVLAADNTPGYRVEFRTASPPQQAVARYRRELVKLGWTALPTYRQNDYTYHQFARTRRTLYLVGWMGTERGGTQVIPLMRISVCAANFTYRCPTASELGIPIEEP